MSGLALAIVVFAALLHASWNFLAKKSKNKMAFIWWFLLIATLAYLPMFLYYWPRQSVSPAGWACIVATGILHALYFWFMGGAYERGDLSLVYPLSRGSGPLFVPILAIIFLQEQLSFAGIVWNFPGYSRYLFYSSEVIFGCFLSRAVSGIARQCVRLGALYRRDDSRVFFGR